jgi:hypothetical protein
VRYVAENTEYLNRISDLCEGVKGEAPYVHGHHFGGCTDMKLFCKCPSFVDVEARL